MVEHPGGVAILAIDSEDRVLLVRQYRYPFERVLTEIPAGKREPGEPPFITAQRELQEEGYSFRSESDCEVLLPLYREYGMKMFGMLNGEFALILFDHRSGHFIAARDSSGQRPLYYGQDDAGNTVFASDAESLMGLCRRVQPFPPGHYYEDGRFIRYDDSVGAA